MNFDLAQRLLVLSLFFISNIVIGQELILGGSFEGSRTIVNREPRYWNRCMGDTTTPDIQPITSMIRAPFGKTYLGLAARGFSGVGEKDGTREALTQSLTDRVMVGQEYLGRVYLNYDQDHITLGRDMQPGRLNIYMGNTICSDSNLIWRSPLINHHNEWRAYQFIFTAPCASNFIRIEVEGGEDDPYWSYVLIDSLSITPTRNFNPLECEIIPEDTMVIDTVEMEMEPDSVLLCEVYIPTAFSPNGDGVNDVFQVNSNCVLQSIQLNIFDRWGNQIFSGSDENSSWDGAVSNQDAVQGTYVYQLLYSFIDQQGSKESSFRSGMIALVK